MEIEIIFISAGFDAHVNDPLANMELTEEGYRQMTELTVKLAEKFSKGRIVSLLEGGYHLPSLGGSVLAEFLAGFAAGLDEIIVKEVNFGDRLGNPDALAGR